MITKHKVENFIIVRPGTAVPAAGDRLYDFATDQINLPLGGFGIYKPVVNSGNPEATALAPTIATANTIKFYQRRDTSGDRSPLNERVFEFSDTIAPFCPVSFNGTGASVSRNNLHLVGAAAGAPNAVPVEDEEEYIVNVSNHGWRTDLFNGKSTPLKMGRFTTPDYFSDPIITTEAQQRDHILMNVAADFNSNSYANILALCIDSAATAAGTPADGVITLNAAIALTPGDSIIIGFADDGQPIRLELDRQLIQTLTDLRDVFGLPGTVQIVAYALPTTANLAVAGRNVAGGQAAATPDAQVDHLAFISLDLQQAFYDEVSQTKERIEVGLDGGFGAGVSNVEAVQYSEAMGLAEDLEQWYDDTKGYRTYPGGKKWQQNSVRYPNEIVAGGIYDMYFLTSCNDRVASSGLKSTSPRMTVIAILNTETPGFAGFTGGVNPQKTYLEDALNAWVGSTQYPHTVVNV
jgi:hypothetical protein